MARLILAVSTVAVLVAGAATAFADPRDHDGRSFYVGRQTAERVEPRRDNDRVWSYYRWREQERLEHDRAERVHRSWWYRYW
jgi:hypothetical protein